MSWRVAPCLLDLRADVDRRWPDRDRRSDGTIGDPAHATRVSDHNPNYLGDVRAHDFDADGMDRDWFAEHVRRLGASGDPRLNPGGYVIAAGRIASARYGWVWRRYTGSNPHEHHTHVSCSTVPDGYRLRGPWGVSATIPPPRPPAGSLTVSDVQTILDRLDRLDGRLDAVTLYLVQLQAEVVGTIDPDGDSRMDRLVRLVLDLGHDMDEITADVPASARSAADRAALLAKPEVPDALESPGGIAGTFPLDGDGLDAVTGEVMEGDRDRQAAAEADLQPLLDLPPGTARPFGQWPPVADRAVQADIDGPAGASPTP